MRIVQFIVLLVAIMFCGISAWSYGWWPGLMAGVVSGLALAGFNHVSTPALARPRDNKLFEAFAYASVFVGWAVGLTVRALQSGLGAGLVA